MENPVVDTQRDVVPEVVERAGLVLGLACIRGVSFKRKVKGERVTERRLVRLGTDDVLKVWVDVRLVREDDWVTRTMKLVVRRRQ